MELYKVVAWVLGCLGVTGYLFSLFPTLGNSTAYRLRIASVTVWALACISNYWPEIYTHPIILVGVLGTYLIWAAALESSIDRPSVKFMISFTLIGTWISLAVLVYVTGLTVFAIPVTAGLVVLTVILTALAKNTKT